MKQIRLQYDGLLTKRLAVVTQPLMSTSSAKVRVKTDTTKEWVEEEDGLTPLETTINITIDG